MAEEHIAPASPPTTHNPPPPIHHEDVHDLVYDMIIYFFGNIGYFVLVALRIGLMYWLLSAGNARYQEDRGVSYWVRFPHGFTLSYWSHVVEACMLILYNIMERRCIQPLDKKTRKVRCAVYLLTLCPHLLFAVIYILTSTAQFIDFYALVGFMSACAHSLLLVVSSIVLFIKWWNTPSVKVHRVKMMNAIHLLCEMGTDLGHFIFEHYF